MSTIQARTNQNSTVYRVVWRDAGRQRTRSFTSEAAAAGWQQVLDSLGSARALALLEDDKPATDTTTTVADAVALHIEALTGVTTGTRSTYRSALRRVIEPSALGRVPVALLTQDDAATWVNALQAQGLGAKTIANHHGLLSAALNTAVVRGQIGANPVKGMRLPRGDHTATEKCFLTPEQVQVLLGATDARFRALVLMLFGTGMRFGEATALRVRDVSPATRSASITRAWNYTGRGKRELGPPKSRRSTRTVAVATEAMDAVAPLLERSGDALLFTMPGGGEVTQRSFYSRVWVPARAVLAGDEIEPAGRGNWRVVTPGAGPRPRVHDARHTFASWAIRAGVPLPVIQRQLGHESITTTIDTYGHLARADFDALADATSRSLSVSAVPALAASASEPPATVPPADA